jgi:hypothetical protein
MNIKTSLDNHMMEKSNIVIDKRAQSKNQAGLFVILHGGSDK